MILQGNLRRSEFENFDKFLVLMKNSLFQRRELTIHFPQEKFTDEVELTITSKSSLQKTNHLFSLAPIAAEILFVFFVGGFAVGKTKRLQRRAGPPFGEETTLLLLNF